MNNTVPFFPCNAHVHRAPPVPDEPLERMPKSDLVCDICGKTFKVHSELDRHKTSVHERSDEAHG